MDTKEFSLPFYEDVLEFLAGGPSVRQVVEYRPSAAAQQRFSAFLTRVAAVVRTLVRHRGQVDVSVIGRLAKIHG